MRPLRSFLLLLIFLACFTGLHYIIHTNQLFPSIHEFVPSVPPDLGRSVYNDSDRLIKETAGIIAFPAGNNNSDTTSLTEAPKEAVKYPLHGFLDSLRFSKRQVRIIYYGDSQIEGDRITSYLRHALRKGRGGTGPGLFLPLMPVMYTRSISIRSSSNWKRYNYLSFKAGEISHRNLGPFMAICRYIPEGETTTQPERAFVRIRPSNVSDSASAEYDFLRVFYGNTRGTVKMEVRSDNSLLFRDTLKTGTAFNEIKCPLYGKKAIEIAFEGRVSPDIYGMSIESDAGVVVDNIAQRGSAGLEFTMVDRNNLQESFKKLAPDLIILQYGLNIVRNVKDNYSYYQKGLLRQILRIKETSPLTPILVVGVSDMAAKEGDSIKSFDNIPSIIYAQKQATVKAEVVFWDSYSAMGGKSSIIKWAAKRPALAQKDFVHFTPPGADTLSSMLESSLFVLRPADTLLNSKSDISEVIVPDAPRVIPDTRVEEQNKPGFFSSLLFSLLNFDPENPLIFTTAAFWIFFLFVLGGYSLIYKKLKIRNVYLFLISLFFYYKAGGLFLFVLLFVTITDYSCGLLIFKSKTVAAKRFFVLLSIISNLGLLAYFKYTGFLLRTINELFGTHFIVYDLLSSVSNSILGTTFDISSIILPVGISFFTFQSLSYTIDVYRRKMEPVKNIIDFGFYVSFFPHLVAGPIVRASVFIPQIYQEFRLSKPEFSHALYMISKGLIKKIVISNFIALNLVDRVFDAPSIYSGFENLLAIYGYGLQIYCDFSGYTDIAIGVALILGFRLPVNFNSPYKANSITDFWKRWHISLSQWLRDYLYISLGGNRKGKIRTYFNLMITMLLGGLWHGASLRYIIWGGLHGFGLVVDKIWNAIFRFRLRNSRAGKILGIFITFQFVNFCWIFFRAPDLESVKTMFRQIFENFSPGSYMTVAQAYSSALVLIAVAYIIHFLPEKTRESYRGLFIKIPLAAQFAVVMAVAVLLFRMRTTEVMPFIYFRF
jgi:alginate O-acetyltransferase complex protein AlgI